MATSASSDELATPQIGTLAAVNRVPPSPDIVGAFERHSITRVPDDDARVHRRPCPRGLVAVLSFQEKIARALA